MLKSSLNFYKSKVFLYVFLQHTKSLLGDFDNDWIPNDSKIIVVFIYNLYLFSKGFFLAILSILLILESWGHVYNLFSKKSYNINRRAKHIYNSITAMGFLAMFTFQLDNTKR